MPGYRWTARTYQGDDRQGELDADNKSAAMDALRKQGLLDIHLRNKSFAFTLTAERIEEKELVVFFRQLSTMISAGVPLVQALEMAVKGSENPAMTKLLKKIQDHIESGSPLTESLRTFPNYFDRLSCSLIDAGEKGGILDVVLLRLCMYKEKALALKSKIKTAMIYPLSIIAVAFLVTTILMVFVVPVFVEMFSGFGQALPLPTQIVVSISDWFVAYWYIVLMFPVVLVYLIRAAYKTDAGRLVLDRLLLRLPILGMVLRKAAVARFCRTFSTLAAAGVPILDSMTTVAEIAGNRVVELAILDSRHSISQGESLTDPLLKSGVFPVMVVQMIRIGEQTGSLEEMLGKVADYYEQEVDDAVNNMTSLMEPLIMVFLGVVIGGLVVSMYLPIFQMASSL